MGLVGAAAAGGVWVGIWFVGVPIGFVAVGVEMTCGNVGIALGFVIVGCSIELMFPGSVNDRFGLGPVGAIVRVIVVVVLVGAVGILVGIVGILVGIVGIVVMPGDGFIGAGIMPIDRRARPSSGSTEIDMFLLDRRRVTRRWLCSWCGFIFFSPDVTVINGLPT